MSHPAPTTTRSADCRSEAGWSSSSTRRRGSRGPSCSTTATSRRSGRAPRAPSRPTSWRGETSSASASSAWAREISDRHGVKVLPAKTVEQAVRGSDLVVTVTPSREPLVRADWVRPGMHITAVGSDGPEKRELDVGVLRKADKVVADRLDQCARLGEIHHAIEAGAMRREDVYAELGEIAAGIKPGRERDDEITVADLTGVGVQDAAVANLVVDAALRRGMGKVLDV